MSARSDTEIIAEALSFGKNDELLRCLKCLRSLSDKSVLETDPALGKLWRMSNLVEQVHKDLAGESPSEVDADGGSWTKQGECHGERDFLIHYKVEEGGRLKCRIDSVIESSLYVPFLAVINETDLFDTWFPKWNFPFKLGLSKSEKLKQSGRVEQLVQLAVDMPFPLKKRDMVLWGFASDDSYECDQVAIKLLSVNESIGDTVVPPPEKNVIRMDLMCDFLVRRCPSDHEALTNSKTHYSENETLILLTFACYCNPKVSFVPQSFLNFCTRTAMGTLWRMLLRIAEEVREGKRPEYAELIDRKRGELYDWVEERATAIVGTPYSKTAVSQRQES